MPRKPGEALLKEQRRKQNAQYNSTRPERHRFYGTRQWRRLRDFVLAGSPLCVECLKHGVITAATLVDHIIPIADGGAEMDVSNLQPLCAACHNRKHGGETAKQV